MEVKQEEAVKRGYDIQRSIEDAKIFNSSPQLKKKKKKKDSPEEVCSEDS